ncbi:MAG: serine/threonine-protein kinase [Gemmatimonadetes bacterium]|nr:serine/threonine-protein kinase [Gemmatimonadota bacterium]
MGDEESDDLDWQRLESLYEAASALPAAERAAFLEEACAQDHHMQRELQSLLSVAAPADVFFGRLDMAARAILADDPTSADPRVGTRIGHYRIEERLGAGGMGVVYRAYDERLRRVVALKFLPPHLSAEETSNRRFFAEARAAASLDHPNICTIYEVGEVVEPGPFIAMAYYTGETLDHTLRRGRLGIPLAVDYAVQIATGLAAAHQRGIVHRDVKPGNVIITTDGIAKILDFGLARPPDAARTLSEGIFGTIAYMSPERAFGHAADHRTDLWSLGVTLYEMVTGQRPFRRESEAATLYAIAHEPPLDPVSLRPELPAALARLILRLLEKEPANRYADARSVIEDLESIASSTIGAEPAINPAAHGPRSAVGRPHTGLEPGGMRRFAKRRTYAILAIPGAVIAAGLISLALLDRPESGAPVSGTGQPNVAVLYFQGDTTSDWLTNALTSSLIGALMNVQGISPLSMNAVRPYRNSPRASPAIAAELGAEWLIDGFIDHVDERVVATSELIEGPTGRRLANRESRRPIGEERALIEDVVRDVIEMLRERLGSEMLLGRWQAGTTDSVAFRLLHIAIGEIEEADQLAASASPMSGWARLRRADSTLARAAEADRDWPAPLIERAWLANKAARLAFGIGASRDSVEAAFERGTRYASAALRGQRETARALEARGVLRHTEWLLLAPQRDTLAARELLGEPSRIFAKRCKRIRDWPAPSTR